MDVITMLRIVRQNLNQIPVMGLDYQSRMVGCGEMVEAAIQKLLEQEKKPEVSENVENSEKPTDS